MKLTKSSLKQLIKEEIKNLSEERDVESMQSELSSEVKDMEYQDAMRYLKHMFRAIQNVMVDITPRPEEPEMEIEDEEMIAEEEVTAKLDSKLEKALEKLVDKFDQLDLSIDFLAAVMADSDPRSIGSGQKAFGRSYVKRPTPKSDQ